MGNIDLKDVQKGMYQVIRNLKTVLFEVYLEKLGIFRSQKKTKEKHSK